MLFFSGERFNTEIRRSVRLDERAKQRIFLKPYSNSVCTTLTPINPFEPVTRICSSQLKLCAPICIRYRRLEVTNRLTAPGARRVRRLPPPPPQLERVGNRS